MDCETVSSIIVCNYKSVSSVKNEVPPRRNINFFLLTICFFKILAKAIGITGIAHFSLNYSVYALKKSDDLNFFM